MRNIELNLPLPRLPPAPVAGAPAAEWQGGRDPYRPTETTRSWGPTRAAHSDAANSIHDCAIEDALAANSAGWMARRKVSAHSAAGRVHIDPMLGSDFPPQDSPVPSVAEPAVLTGKPVPAAVVIKSERPGVTPVEQTHPARGRRDFTPAIWSGAGFIVGVLVWHTVGFWSFVSNAVFNADDISAPQLEASMGGMTASEQKAMSRIPESAVMPAPAAFKHATAETQFACVALMLDRSAGITNAGACTRTAVELRDAGFNRRTDRLVLRPRLQDPVAWTGTTAVQVSEAAAGASAPITADELPTLPDADLKLNLD